MIGGRRDLRLALPIGDVEGDADERRAARLLVLDQFGALSQPDPAAVGRAHAKLDVDIVASAIGGELGNRLEAHVLWMNERLQFRHRPWVRPFGEVEHVEHRGRPDDATAANVPGPQSAAAAIERQIDAGAAGAVVASALEPRARIGGVEAGRDEEERDRRGEQGHDDCRHVPPAGKVHRHRRATVTMTLLAPTVALFLVAAELCAADARARLKRAREDSARRARVNLALNRGRCGLWTWDIDRGRIVWSASMFAVLDLAERPDPWTVAELQALVHPEDLNLETIAQLATDRAGD